MDPRRAFSPYSSAEFGERKSIQSRGHQRKAPLETQRAALLFASRGIAGTGSCAAGRHQVAYLFSASRSTVDEPLWRAWNLCRWHRFSGFGDFRPKLRAFFLALGIYALILGLECLFLDKAVLIPNRESMAQQMVPSAREIHPAEWAPWSLISAGAVVILYSFTIPAKMRG